jgi:hypothetical protein
MTKKQKSDLIVKFLEWTNEHDISLCLYTDEDWGDNWNPINETKESIIEKFLKGKKVLK